MTPPEPRGGEGLTAEIVADHRRLATWNSGKDRPKRVAFHHDAASHIERLQADSDRLRAFSPSSPPSGGGGWPSREEVARVLDLEAVVADLEYEGSKAGGAIRARVLRERREGAFNSADAILALFPPVANEMVRDQTDGVEGMTARRGPWRCFHCDELCKTVEAAEHHFGQYDGSTPVCQVAAETYRALEREVQSYRSECDADTVLFYSLGAKHATAMREAEQTGYDRGIADAKAYPETLGLTAQALRDHPMKGPEDE